MPSLYPGGGTNDAKLWTYTNNFNMRDLSRDDDFLSYLLVETFGTDDTPLVVHRMHSFRGSHQFDPEEVLQIIKKFLLFSRLTMPKRIRGAVDALLFLPAVHQYRRCLTNSQLNAFATHTARYLEIYLPTSVTEIAHTSRYSHRTGKAELCILATQQLPVGTVLTELKGSMAVLTDAENEDLKRTGRAHGARRDFSVIHSGHRKKNHLFLGPARFVNHDCENNCELVREGKYITFRVLKPIDSGQEITAHYGDSYFGKGNRFCLCETCELLGRGGYREDPYTDSDHDSDSEVSIPSSPKSFNDVRCEPQPNKAHSGSRTRGILVGSSVASGLAGDNEPKIEENVIQVDDITPEQTAAILTPVSPSPSSSALDQRVHSPEGNYTRYSPILSHMSSEDINSSPKSVSTRNSLTTSTNHSRDTARSASSASQHPPLSPSGSSIHSKPTSLSPGFRTGSPVSFTSISVRDSPQSMRVSIPSRASSRSSCRHENDGSQMPTRVPPPIRKSMRLASGSIPGKMTAPISTNSDSVQQSRNPKATMQIKKEEEISDASLIARVTRSSLRIGNQTTAVVNGKDQFPKLSPTTAPGSFTKTSQISSSGSPRKRGRPPKQPKCCSTCAHVLTSGERGTTKVNDEVECVRCKRHSKIFGARWPSRVPLWTPPFPSPSPEPVPIECMGNKRTLASDQVNERAPKRQRTDAGLSKQELKRLRKNERRRIARAKAREERKMGAQSLSLPKGTSTTTLYHEEPSDSSDEEGRVTLQTLVQFWDEGFSFLDRTPPAGQFDSIMKRTPDALSRRFWSRLTRRYAEAGWPQDSSSSSASDDSHHSESASEAEDEKNPFSVVHTSSMDCRPSTLARRRRDQNTGLLQNDEPSTGVDPGSRTQVRVTYLSSATTHKSCRLKHKSLTQTPLHRNVRSSSVQTCNFVDHALGQLRSAPGRLAYDDCAFYEASEDRLDVCNGADALSNKYGEIPDPSTWSFHIRYLPKKGIGEDGDCHVDPECFAASRTGALGRAQERSRLTLPGTTSEPPWMQEEVGEKAEASSGKSPDKTAFADLLDEGAGCEYPSMESRLELRTSLGFQPPWTRSGETGLKGACWKES